MKKNVKKIILIIITIGVAFLYAHVDKNYYLYDRNQDASEYISTGILKNERIEQDFIAQSDKIDGIEIKSTVTGDVSDVEIIYQLLDRNSGKVIVKGIVEGTKFENSKFYQIDFDEIKNTNGKEFTLILEEKNSDDMNGISFCIASKTQPEVCENLTVKGNDANGVLVFRIIRNGFDFETFIVFLLFIAYIVGFMKVLYKLFK